MPNELGDPMYAPEIIGAMDDAEFLQTLKKHARDRAPFGKAILLRAAAEIERLEALVKTKHDDAADAAAQGFDWMTRAEAAESKLAAVEALAEKWDKEYGEEPEDAIFVACASELRTALEHNNA